MEQKFHYSFHNGPSNAYKSNPYFAVLFTEDPFSYDPFILV